MKAFFKKVWAWVLAHKLIAGIIAGAFVVALTVAIVVPVSVSASRKKKAAQESQQQQQPSGGGEGGGQQGGEGGEGGGTAPSALEEFTVTWKDGSGKVLEIDDNVKKGSMPEFDGQVPNDPISYESETYKVFKSWDKDFAPVTADVTYTATYETKIYNGQFPKINSDKSKVKYGLYPQRHVQISSFEDELNDNLNDGSPELDVVYEYQGKYYLKTEITQTNDRTFSDGDPATLGSYAWFYMDPIEWKVLKNNNERYTLFSNIALEAKAFNPLAGMAQTNDWVESELRAWLNGDFFNMAFNLGNGYVQTSIVDNSAASTGVEENPFAGEETNDKVYLLSNAETAIGSDYGFTAENRILSGTDYFVAHNGYLSNNTTRKTVWYLRSPKQNNEINTDRSRVQVIDHNGSNSTSLSNIEEGIAPVIEINLA